MLAWLYTERAAVLAYRLAVVRLKLILLNFDFLINFKLKPCPLSPMAHKICFAPPS